jgi:FkbM family methyltransferase
MITPETQYDSHLFGLFDKAALMSFPVGTEEDYGAIIIGNRNITSYESGLSNFIHDNLTAEHTFFDIGAQIGLFSALASSMGARCVSLEMRTSLVKGHYMTKAANGFERWTPLNFAVDDSLGIIPYDDNAQFPLIGDVSDRAPSGSVLSVPLDQFIGLVPDDAPVMIKLDVEGFEVKAMRGMKDLMARKRPVMCVECHPHAAWAFGDHISQVGTLLPTDYRMYVLRDHRQGTGVEVSPITAVDTFSDNFLVICSPSEFDLKGISIDQQ